MKNPWSAIQKPTSDVNVRLVGSEHPLKLYWGRDTQGRYLFIYESEADGMPPQKALPDLAGVTTRMAHEGAVFRLIFILNESANWELFHALCTDLVRATSLAIDGPAASAVVLRRLNRWQEFLRKSRSGILPIEKIKGLIGELLFLSNKTVPVYGWDEAVNFWKGPEDAPQDFAIHGTAIEVKCQSGGSKPSVRISSAEQLDHQLPEGFLVVYTIATAGEEDSDRFDLNGLVNSIRKNLETASETARERFEDLLYLAGYTASEKYDELRFVEIAVKCFGISDGFPRIVASNVPPGIDHVSYSLKLEACSGFEAKPDWW